MSFNVYSLDTNDEDVAHWSEGLFIYIEKDGVKIELTGDEMKLIIDVLPRTFGGRY